MKLYSILSKSNYLLLFFFFTQICVAQNSIISGSIKGNSGESLPGVSIVVKGTTTGYSFTASGGAIKNDAIITTATTAAQVTVVSTASEAFGTATTATSTVHLCINSGCSCSSVLAASGSTASAITAGLLSIIMVFMIKLK